MDPGTLSAVTGSTGGAVAPSPRGTLGKDDFLRLLITQLRNQDPLHPLDQNQFLAQTAQFAALEQLQAIGKGLEALRASGSGASIAGAAMLVGRTAAVAGATFAFDGVTPPSLPFELDLAASRVDVEILDEEGSPLRQIELGPTGAGARAVGWDGRDSAGRPVTRGTYFYRVSASGAPGAPAPVATAAVGPLEGLSVRGGRVLYRLGDRLVRLEDVVGVR